MSCCLLELAGAAGQQDELVKAGLPA